LFSCFTNNQVSLTLLKPLAPGEQLIFEVHTLVDKNASGSLSNGVRVWSPWNDDQDPDDETSSPPTTIDPVDYTLDIPNTFTPNGDGLNDYFVINGLEKYDENEITILNRWGNRVYQQKDYQNNWSADQLNDGTYFYILRVRSNTGGWKEHKGYIGVVRNK